MAQGRRKVSLGVGVIRGIHEERIKNGETGNRKEGERD